MADKAEFKLEDIEGLGEKKASQLREELDIDNAQELEEALEDGRVDALDGFGPKTIENLKEAVAKLEAGEEELEAVAEESVAEVEEPVVVEEETSNIRRKKVTNRDVDVLFADVSARVRNKYDEIIVTADKHYVRDRRINFLFALVSNMAKEGAIIKFPEEFFNNMPNAKVEDGYWIIEKGE
jgi:DNA polymerase/3'-5' exonuclease PolX